ncbi:MAG: hypothetical protein K2H85_03830, partial [Allobaculum sp.]|nr:hypothetical protein [Allobaculum sp.]
LQEVMEKIYDDFIADPLDGMLLVDNITFIKCGQDGCKVIGSSKWLPEIKDCGGIAPIVECLTGTVKPMLKTQNKNVVVVISDGYWCGGREELSDFEFNCYSKKLCTLVEINIGNNSLWNLVISHSLKLNNLDERLTQKISKLF